MKASIILYSFATILLSRAVHACQVTLDGEDKTNDFFVVDSVTGESYVDCIGHYKCRDAIISDCPVIKCFENEACLSAQIINFTNTVLCNGLHSCHRTEMTASDSSNSKQTVSCVGSEACDVAQISGANLEQVSCSGVKACRKVHVEGAKLVKCHEGRERTPACDGFATLETKCLYCGKNGCSDHINTCRYEITGTGDGEGHQYQKCQPEKLVGDCPAELESELSLELSGKEQMEIEGGARKSRQLRGFDSMTAV